MVAEKTATNFRGSLFAAPCTAWAGKNASLYFCSYLRQLL